MDICWEEFDVDEEQRGRGMNEGESKEEVDICLGEFDDEEEEVQGQDTPLQEDK